jgi:rhodanese-related sulfurtransferase
MICRAAAVLVILAVGVGAGWASEKVPRMTKEQLKDLVGKPDVVILDVRSKSDWEKGQTKIQGAVREDPGKATKTWAEKYAKDKNIVLYCA